VGGVKLGEVIVDKKVVYTAIIGGYDELVEIDNKPSDWDFVCFSDRDLKSDTWEIRNVIPLYSDNTRTARKYKLLPHRWFPKYTYSLWLDGNIKPRGDINELLTYLDDCNYATYSHNQNKLDPRDCIYEEASTILQLGDKNIKRNPKRGMLCYKDNPNLIRQQMINYQNVGYPTHHGLVVQMEVLRRHNESDVKNAMEDHWVELKHNSKREQLSFNYIAWKNGLKFNYIDGDSRDNEYFLNMGKHIRGESIPDVIKTHQPISMQYFLNMELQPGGGGKREILDNYTLRTVEDVVKQWENMNVTLKYQKTLIPSNYQYFNAMVGEFRHGVEDHHKIGWDKLTSDYFESKELMTDDEIAEMLKSNPAEFDNGYIKHSYHRACAMIGRLIRGKSYIPFYMKTEDIFDNPREKDNMHRIKSPIYDVKYLLEIEHKLGIPRSEFTVCQSGILALMGIRENDDIDIIISQHARDSIFNGNKKFMRFGKFEIFELGKSKFMKYGATDEDDLINNYSIQVDGFNFLEPRFYFSRKNNKTAKDMSDWSGIRKFFDDESHIGYPFNEITLKQWGHEFICQM
jgi:hypothetical protein